MYSLLLFLVQTYDIRKGVKERLGEEEGKRLWQFADDVVMWGERDEEVQSVLDVCNGQDRVMGNET